MGFQSVAHLVSVFVADDEKRVAETKIPTYMRLKVGMIATALDELLLLLLPGEVERDACLACTVAMCRFRLKPKLQVYEQSLQS